LAIDILEIKAGIGIFSSFFGLRGRTCQAARPILPAMADLDNFMFDGGQHCRRMTEPAPCCRTRPLRLGEYVQADVKGGLSRYNERLSRKQPSQAQFKHLSQPTTAAKNRS
jgi:hypothetical protein